MKKNDTITGQTLLDWGFESGSWFGKAIQEARYAQAEDMSLEDIREKVVRPLQPVKRNKVYMRSTDTPSVMGNLTVDTEEERENHRGVRSAMEQLMRVPTVVNGAYMPDACPAGIIPVGGVIRTLNEIHPGFHSADICCSVAYSNLGNTDPKAVLDKAMGVTHFGPGGRKRGYQYTPSASVMNGFRDNKYLSWLESLAIEHFATQGDGNHFLYVGKLKSTGDTIVVTHHGSRGPGAKLYKSGIRDAQHYVKEFAPDIPAEAAWLSMDTQEGQDYWEALQVIKEWTRESHFKIHQLLGFDIQDHFWNEHNFVFKREDGYYHAKGATPGWAHEYERTIVPLNMGQPILITRGTDNPNSLGFLPHGAGRNMSRTKFLQTVNDKKQFLAEQTKGIDVRFFSGHPDLTELPAAYKDADKVKREIEYFGLATVLDEVLPYGTIMAGDWQIDFRGKWNKLKK